MKKGFTLLELLVVVAIIGILATLLLMNLSSSRGRARDARRKSDLQAIGSAIDVYEIAHGFFPAGLDQAVVDIKRSNNASCNQNCPVGDINQCLACVRTEGYIKSFPLDPLDGRGFRYVWMGLSAGTINRTGYKIMTDPDPSYVSFEVPPSRTNTAECQSVLGNLSEPIGLTDATFPSSIPPVCRRMQISNSSVMQGKGINAGAWINR